VTQVTQGPQALQVQAVSWAILAGQELQGQQDCLEMALQEQQEQEDFVDTTDIRVFSVLWVGN